MEDTAAESTEDNNEEIDLLELVTEDNGDPWNPADDDDVPRGIQGRVLSMTTIPSDYSDDDIPLVELEEGDGHVWSIRGYHLVLRNQLEKERVNVDDFIAIKHFGQPEGKDYENYKVLNPNRKNHPAWGLA